MKTDLWLHAPLLLLALSSLCSAMLPAQAEEKAPASKIASALQPFVDSHSLAGAVTLVADKERTLDLEAVGYADIAAHKAMTTDALFWIASESKPITATCLMNIDTTHDLITIWMVQHAGFPGTGDQSSGAFRGAAEEQFANVH